ncbi:MAG: phage integrase N-terminal SAM-like domain-containing protein [Candidatus Bathyarchaeota archaeon]|nr:phage integrase N-terminal SAM-like domain-containing protein [Candidatus Bathyarchaeota archaeon]
MQKIQEMLIQYQKHMELRGYAVNTQKAYFAHVNYFLGLYPQTTEVHDCDNVREFLYAQLSRGLSQNYVNSAYSALKFFFEVTLRSTWDKHQMPRLKKDLLTLVS